MLNTFSEIPIIDFAPFINGDANIKNLIANIATCPYCFKNTHKLHQSHRYRG